jgi:hypothetical protein
MAQKPLSKIIRQAETHLAQGVHPDDLEHLLGRDDFAVWEKEAQAKTAGNRPWLAGFNPAKAGLKYH